MDAMGLAVAAKTKIDAKLIGLIKDSTIARTVAGKFGDAGASGKPKVSIHLRHEQHDLQLVKKVWEETAQFRDDGIEIIIFYPSPGQEDSVTYSG